MYACTCVRAYEYVRVRTYAYCTWEEQPFRGWLFGWTKRVQAKIGRSSVRRDVETTVTRVGVRTDSRVLSCVVAATDDTAHLVVRTPVPPLG